MRWIARASGALASVLLVAGAHAASLQPASTTLSNRYCDKSDTLTARQQDRLLRVAAALRRELDASGQPLALVSRSGTDLRSFGVRYSHMGIAVREGLNTPWAVRQLYYACDEHQPRLFDQGLAGFLFGTDDPSRGYVSIVTLPSGSPKDMAQRAALERAVLDRPTALRLLAAQYSANAYAFGTQFQNCNQWVIELLATAWGGLADSQAAGSTVAHHRARAQAWLQQHSYQPQQFALSTPLPLLATAFMPLLHLQDHPDADIQALRLQISMPASIEQFVRQQMPAAQRLEMCHQDDRVVIRRGWQPIADGCVPEAGDTVIALD